VIPKEAATRALSAALRTGGDLAEIYVKDRSRNEIIGNIVAAGKDLRVVPFAGAIGAPTLQVYGVTIGGTSGTRT
jgi:hypothetical protein